MTKASLEKQNRDLRIKFDNLTIKSEIKEIALRDDIGALERSLSGKDKAIGMLQKEIASLTLLIEKLQIENKELKQELEKTRKEVQRLTSIISKNSSNSSKPPSTDGYHKIPNSREKSQRPSGGQKGHPGRRLQLPENLDDLVEMGLAEKRIVDHTDGSEEYTSRWTLDLEVKTIVTEHRFPKGEALPNGMENEVIYGDNIKAITVLLSTEGIIAQERLAAFLKELTGGVLSPSDATVENFLTLFARKLPNELEAIENNLLNNSVMGVDDTPLNCTEKPEYGQPGETPVLKTAEKTSFSVTLRNYSNELSTLYTVNPQKDKAGVDRDGILPRYTGTLSHDHESKFYNYGIAHATCGEHLSRDLQGLYELEKCPWANQMRSFVLGMNDHKKTDLKNGITACNPDVLSEYEKQYDALLVEGWLAHSKLNDHDLGYNELRAMLNRLQNYKDCYLLFMRDYSKPFTNNLSERDLRSSKTKQKVSGCFRSWKGVKNYAANSSFISTAKKRGLNLLDSITSVFKGIPVFSDCPVGM